VPLLQLVVFTRSGVTCKVFIKVKHIQLPLYAVAATPVAT
jgi:hypothetical protein